VTRPGSDNLRLFQAVRHGDLAAVDELLDARPDLVDAVETWSDDEAREARMPYAAGTPAIVRAAERDDLAIVRTLVERGADVAAGRPNALWVAVMARYPAVVRYLAEHGADVQGEAAETGLTPLHVAAMRGWDELVELLLGLGADPDRRDAGGRTPLDWARRNGHEPAAGILAAAPVPVRPAGGPAPAAPVRRTRHPGGGWLTAAVMTHPRRLEAAERLRYRHPELELELVIDPRPSDRPSPLRTARVAWGMPGRNASHHLVVQDDVELCSGFLRHVEAAVASAPGAALSLYTEWGNRTASVVRLAALLGSSWAEVVDPYVPTQALVLPARVAAGFDEFAERAAGDDLMDDTVMRAYLRELGIPAVVSVPNLVQHRDGGSLLGNDVRLGPRRSACYAPDVGESRGWAGETTAPTLVPFTHWQTGQALSDLRRNVAGHEWQRIRTERLLTFRGLGQEVVGEALAEVLARLEEGAGVERAIGRQRLGDLWISAVALGVSLAELCDGRSDTVSIEGALARPAADLALSTMPPGVLRGSCGADVLERWAGVLAALVRQGVRCGFTWAMSA
jgi:hypothetical protein